MKNKSTKNAHKARKAKPSRALIVIDNKPIRDSAMKKYKTTMRKLDKAQAPSTVKAESK